MKQRKIIKRKFREKSRVVYIGKRRMLSIAEPSPEPGDRGAVQWEYYGSGGEFSVLWDATPEHRAFRSHHWADDLDWEPVIDSIARLA